MIVADCNLLAYYLIESRETSFAERVRTYDSQWVSPRLVRYELLNILTQHMKKRGMPRDFAVAVYKQAMDVLADSGHDVDPLAVLNLCNNHKVTAYDAAYVVLARELDIELISADKQLIAEFPDNVRSIFSFA